MLAYVNEFPFDYEKETDKSMVYHCGVLTRARRTHQRAIIDALQINVINDGVVPRNIEGEIDAAGGGIVELS